MKALPSKRTSEYIAEQVADEILSARIRAGTELKQEELADSIGASRIPVREALQLLENQGLVERLSTRHIIVTEFNEQNIMEIYEMIYDMECRVITHMVKNAEADKNFMRFQTEHGFHRNLCEVCENPFIKKLLSNSVNSYIRYAASLDGSKERLQMQKEAWQQISQMQKPEMSALKKYFDMLSEAVIAERRKYQS